MREDVLDSLQRRIRAMHRLWELGTRDLRPEQVNHRERPGVLPIAFTLAHYVTNEDLILSRFVLGAAALWPEGWAERVGLRPGIPVRGTPIEVAEQTSLEDLEAWLRYQRAVFDRTEAALDGLAPERLREELFGGEMPASLDGAFVTFVVGPKGPVRLLDALECFIYQHGIRHAGELEHARALVGLRGLT